MGKLNMDEAATFEELEIKLDAISSMKKAMILSGADADKLNEAIIEKAKEHQTHIDSLGEEQFAFEVLMNVIEAKERHRMHEEIQRNQE